MLRSFFKCYALVIFAVFLSALYIGSMLLSFPDDALIAASITALFTGWRHKANGWYFYAFFMALAAMREHDMHAMHTTMSLLKSRFYISPDVPLNEKIIGAAIILALVFAVIKSLPHIWATLKRALTGVKYAQAGYTAMGFLLFAKMLDSSSRLFPWLAESFSPYSAQMQFTEEALEMIMAFLFLSAPLLYLYKRR